MNKAISSLGEMLGKMLDITRWLRYEEDSP